MKRKRLKKGQVTVAVGEDGIPRDATGHRTDRPATYSSHGKRLWRADELQFALGERVRAVQSDSEHPEYQRMAQGEVGTIVIIEEFVMRDYLVVPDRLIERFEATKSGLYLARMKEHYLEPE